MWGKLMRRLLNHFGPSRAEVEHERRELEQIDRNTEAIVERLRQRNEEHAHALGMTLGQALSEAWRQGQGHE